ncbi:MAG: putative porin, partial [Janthinobacterium sp.]
MNLIFSSPQRLRRLPLALAALALSVAAGAVQAEAAAPADSTMVKLIRGLIQSGALNKDAGEALLAQAQSEALARPVAAPAALAQVQPGDVRVPYLSHTVREQIRDEIKGQVLAEAKAGGWAAPNETPAWTKRIRVEGDVRARYESRYYDMANSNIEIDWRSLNSGSGYDVNSNTNLALPALL